jgi:plastocyanin domain-containing protein
MKKSETNDGSNMLIGGFVGVLAFGLLIGLMVMRAGAKTSPSSAAAPEASNVQTVDGTQIITINAKGGYRPEDSTAKAGVPTVIRFQTNGTFDCSSVIRIPSLGISKTLPSSGATDVAVGPLQPGTLQGTCGMGMYRFSVNVKS